MKQQPQEKEPGIGRKVRPLACITATICCGLLILLLGELRSVSAPTWWTSQGVITTNAPADFAPATLGQLKNFARKAYDEFQTNLQNGAGSGISNLVFGFANSNNYAPVTLGQLKNVATSFYGRLVAVGYTNTYPWTATTTDDQNFAAANIGQLKRVFDFTLDADGDGLPDWWENLYLGGITNQTGTDDPDGDAYSNLEEYQGGTSPTNATSHPWNISGTVTYGGRSTGTVRVVATALSNGWTAVKSASSNMPGVFTITHLPYNSNYWVKAYVDINDDASNEAIEAFGAYAGNPIYLTNNVTNVTITLTDPDLDADSLPDWWEAQYGFSTASGGGSNGLAWWKLDENSGTNVLDSCSFSNHGTAVNLGVNAWTAGVISNALVLGTTNGYVQFYNMASLCPTTVSISMWIKPTLAMGSNIVAVFFSKLTNGASSGYGLSYSNGSILFVVGVNGTACTLRATQALSTNWYQLVATYNGSNQMLYVNGIATAQSNYTWGSSISVIGSNGVNPRMGATSVDPPTNFFAGTIDDVQLDRQAWSSNAVYGLYQVGADSDGDGLSNWQEYQLRTNPTNADTDADSFSDGEEVNLMGTDPVNAEDGVDILESARAAIMSQWDMIYRTPLSFTNQPGSQADINDMRDALVILSSNFYVEAVLP